MAKILFGDAWLDPATGRPKSFIVSLINVNSPMTYDATMLGALKVYARANQACIVTPFILAGAMSPVTIAGTATQTLAEALAGMAFMQLLNPGCPMVLGSFASSLSMQSGAPTFGTPEPALVLYIMASLARRLGVPFRSGGSLCAAKIPDAQAAFESAQTLLPTCLAGVNFVLHTTGWLEGGLAMGYEKFVMDADQAGMMHTLLAGVDLSENGQALSAIREVGPGKHFLGCAHTLANFETAFYRSPLADNNSFEQWAAEGRKDMAVRANERWKKHARGVRRAAARCRRGRGAARLHEPAQGRVPGFERVKEEGAPRGAPSGRRTVPPQNSCEKRRPTVRGRRMHAPRLDAADPGGAVARHAERRVLVRRVRKEDLEVVLVVAEPVGEVEERARRDVAQEFGVRDGERGRGARLVGERSPARTTPSRPSGTSSAR